MATFLHFSPFHYFWGGAVFCDKVLFCVVISSTITSTYINLFADSRQLHEIFMDNINVYPMLATWKASKKDGRCPIHLSVDINGKRAAFPSTKKKCLPEQWDTVQKRVKDKVANAALINATIQKFKGEIEAELMKKQLSGKTLNKQMVKKQVKSGKSGADFYKFSLEQIQILYKGETKRTYETELTKMQQYRTTLTFADIDYLFLQGYKHYMQSERKNEDNTIWKSLKFISRMINLAIATGDLIGESPFEEFDRGTYTQGIPEYLEWPEVKKLHESVKSSDTLTDDLRLVGYYSLLSYYSGLRFGDAVAFTYDKYVIQADKAKRLLLYAGKNGEIVSIEFTDEINEVVEYIKGRPLPKTTNQEFNRKLKLIGVDAKIKKPLKSHMGRHSFAMRCAELGMSEEAVQHLLGHRDRRSTRIYFRVKNNRIDAEMKAWNK